MLVLLVTVSDSAAFLSGHSCAGSSMRMRGDDLRAATDSRRRTSFPSTTASVAVAAFAFALILVSSSVSAAVSSDAGADDDVIYGDDGGVKFRRFVFYLKTIMSRPLLLY